MRMQFSSEAFKNIAQPHKKGKFDKENRRLSL